MDHHTHVLLKNDVNKATSHKKHTDSQPADDGEGMINDDIKENEFILRWKGIINLFKFKILLNVINLII